MRRLRTGDPAAILPIIHYVLLRFSRHVALDVAASGYEVRQKKRPRCCKDASTLQQPLCRSSSPVLQKLCRAVCRTLTQEGLAHVTKACFLTAHCLQLTCDICSPLHTALLLLTSQPADSVLAVTKRVSFVHCPAQLQGKTDARFLETVLKLARDHFGLKPVLTCGQFLEQARRPKTLSTLPAHQPRHSCSNQGWARSGADRAGRLSSRAWCKQGS